MDRYIAPQQNIDLAHARLYGAESISPGPIIPRTSAVPASTETYVLTPPPSPRRKPERCFRSLDLPDLLDDFYQNVLAWPDATTVLLGLQNSVYHYHVKEQRVFYQMDIFEPVKSVARHEKSTASGTGLGRVFLSDDATGFMTSYSVSDRRIMALHLRQHGFFCGTMQGSVVYQDVRTNVPVVSFSAHKAEILKLSLSPFSDHQLATGGNDDQVHVYDLRRTTSPVFSYAGHTAAVKALTFSPLSAGTLYSGGGTGDCTIVTHHVPTSKSNETVKTAGQVTSVHVVNRGRLISTHGFMRDDGDAERICWHGGANGPVFSKSSTRVLDAALSPNRQVLATINASERLDFYDLSPYVQAPKSARQIDFDFVIR